LTIAFDAGNEGMRERKSEEKEMDCMCAFALKLRLSRGGIKVKVFRRKTMIEIMISIAPRRCIFVKVVKIGNDRKVRLVM
jgi:hypothetical protein